MDRWQISQLVQQTNRARALQDKINAIVARVQKVSQANNQPRCWDCGRFCRTTDMHTEPGVYRCTHCTARALGNYDSTQPEANRG